MLKVKMAIIKTSCLASAWNKSWPFPFPGISHVLDKEMAFEIYCIAFEVSSHVWGSFRVSLDISLSESVRGHSRSTHRALYTLVHGVPILVRFLLRFN